MELAFLHSISGDILTQLGTKTRDDYFLIQHFDFILNGHTRFFVPDSVPKKYNKLMKALRYFAKHKKKLAQQHISLFMKDAYLTCSLVLHSYAKDKRLARFNVRTEFEKKEWEYVENLFLKAGLAVCKRSEKRTIQYKLNSLETHYEITVENGKAVLCIESPDEDRLLRALSPARHMS